MNFIKTEISEVIIIEPDVFSDNRGYFFENFRMDLFEKNVKKINFIQENESKSIYGVLRGLHFQIPPFAQSKLVRVIKGKILDIAVDIRKGSPTFLKIIKIELDEINKKQLFIPKGFAHGFLVLSEECIINYKVDNYYSKEHDRGINFNDKTLNINLGIDKKYLIQSAKDKNLPELEKTELINYNGKL